MSQSLGVLHFIKSLCFVTDFDLIPSPVGLSPLILLFPLIDSPYGSRRFFTFLRDIPPYSLFHQSRVFRSPPFRAGQEGRSFGPPLEIVLAPPTLLHSNSPLLNQLRSSFPLPPFCLVVSRARSSPLRTCRNCSVLSGTAVLPPFCSLWLRV